MKVERALEINIQIETDGDFDLRNEDGYFEESFESYSKSIFLNEYSDENIIKECLETLISSVKERAFNKYNQKEGLISYIKDIDLNFESYNDLHRKESNKVYPYILNSVKNSFTYLSGNHSIKLYLNKIVFNKLENESEKKEYDEYLRLKSKYEHLTII